MLVSSSFYDLIASIQLCIKLNQRSGLCAYSKFNLKILSFLVNRGLFSGFTVFKKGSSGKIRFFLRQIGGSFLLNGVFSPANKSSSFLNKLSKYKSYRSLAKSFSSEFVIVSTSNGLMTANEALSMRLGGSVIMIIK